jgi:RNA polymerase sigma factor (sigma-70 family)
MPALQPTASLTDADLIAWYKKSADKRAVGELYTRYTGMVYGVCFKYLKDREEAKDAVMQLFEKLLSSLLTHEVSYFKSWLYASARNHCLMQLRTKKGKYTEELSPFFMETASEAHLHEDVDLEGNISKLEKCIQQLTTQQKECVELFFLQEKCYQEVSVTTGYDMKKVKSYIQNGKRNLKICLEQNA